jgi:HEAT repeat protein
MDPFVVAFGAAVAVAGARRIVSMRREALRRVARPAVARACGLTQVLLHDRVVTGMHGALRIRMETPESRPRTTRVSVEGLVRSVQVVSAGSGPDRPGLVFADRDVTVGDADFDAVVLLQGPTATLRGLFTASARARALAVFRPDAHVRVGGGSLIAEFGDRRGPPAPSEEQLGALLALAHALEPGAADVTRLVAIAHTDPVVRVRATALETLVKEARDVAPTRTALRKALDDPDASIRLLAATTLGEAGRPTLQALAAAPSVEDATSAAAVAALGGHMTFARALPLLESALSDGRTRTACALLKVLGRGSTREAPALLSVLERARAPETSPAADAIVTAAIEALLDTGAPAPEDVLLRALASRAPGASQAAVRGLARFGTARAVPALREAEGRSELGRAARESIVAIKARLTGATPGQVSLAGGDAGQISVVESADGHVSIPPEDAAR